MWNHKMYVVKFLVTLAPSTNDFYNFLRHKNLKYSNWGDINFFCAKKTTKIWKNTTKITTIAYNLKMCLNFFIFIFWILLNFAKHKYRLSPFKHQHEIE
jgi:hypothetical protein